jgi:5-methylcytosine-specific restriction protein B
MGIFNRGISDKNRNAIARELANFLGVSEPVPDTFAGIPVLNNYKSLFFGFDKERQPDDIDTLWEIFAQAISFAKSGAEEAQARFGLAFDNAMQHKGVGWNLTMGLYWVRPWNYPSLDALAKNYITKELNIQIGMNGPEKRCNANDYLALVNTLKARFQEDNCLVHSFPGLSLEAWWTKDTVASPNPNASSPSALDEKVEVIPEAKGAADPLKPYTIDNILDDGCFIARKKLKKIIERFEAKKNLILQGPPGTGKSWLAKRLAFALVGECDNKKVRAVQFHPNLSYEDFIRGWRPVGDGKLELADGPFLKMAKAAENDSKSKYVLVIEESNRGNPAQVFGEMLTLLEADKRTPNEALELSYKRSDGERFYIPENFYVIGTMNIADRSLALVDLALRRRFAFIDLEPTFGKPWQEWVKDQCGIDSGILIEIEERLIALNKTISEDNTLGHQFRVGHSYVTPPAGALISDGRQWFRQVVETEIGPLLDEYWFDTLTESLKARERLLEGF